MRSRSSSSASPSHPHLPLSSHILYPLVCASSHPFLPHATETEPRAGWDISLQSIHFTHLRKTPYVPPRSMMESPAPRVPENPILKGFFFFFFKWHSYKESERMQEIHFEEQISKIRLPETGVCFQSCFQRIRLDLKMFMGKISLMKKNQLSPYSEVCGGFFGK